MAFSLLEILSSIAIFLLCFLAVILIARGDKGHRGAALLGWFLLLNGLNYLGGLLFISDLAFTYPSLVFWTNALPLTFGPLIWLYTRSLTGKPVAKRMYVLHFLPFLLAFLLTVFGYHIQPYEQKLQILKMSLGNLRNSPPVIISTLLLYVHALIYMTGSIQQVLRFRKSLKNHYASAEAINVKWWIILISLYGLVLFMSFVNSLYGFTENNPAYEASLLALSFTTLLFAAFFMYRAIVSPFHPTAGTVEKYAGSPLNDNDLNQLEEALDKVMTKDKLFRESNLSIDLLASRLNTNGRWLSQLINQRKEMNFFDYINSLRVEEACSILSGTKDEKLTVLEVMYDCGFNSKSSFNTSFRRYTGLTPSQYRKKIRSTS